jgi:hypothetical protein
MKTIIIKSRQEFNDNYNELKESARVMSIPNVFLVGLDTEYITSGTYPEAYKGAGAWVRNTTGTSIAICLIQLSTEEICLVINLVKLKNDIPESLLDILRNDSWIKVGVGVELDLKYLSSNYELGHCAGGIELRNIALLGHYKSPSLENLYSDMVGRHVRKTSSICNWSGELKREQLEYAARDAMMSYQLFKVMLGPSIEWIKEKEGDKTVKDKLSVEIINLEENIGVSLVSEVIEKKSNYIGELNEYAQQRRLALPLYEIKEVSTCPSVFQTTCYFNGKKVETQDRSKQLSKKKAAEKMKRELGIK